jgi:5-methylcytosine-specific restriction endonuclease McrA
VSKTWQGGSTRAWRAQRLRVLRRDLNMCRLNVTDVCVGTSVPMHVHHVHGKASGCPGCAADRADHLIATCAPCNLHVGDPTRQGEPPCNPITRWT